MGLIESAQKSTRGAERLSGQSARAVAVRLQKYVERLVEDYGHEYVLQHHQTWYRRPGAILVT